MLIVPSVLPADFARLGDEVRELCVAGVDRIQWDVMDGKAAAVDLLRRTATASAAQRKAA